MNFVKNVCLATILADALLGPNPQLEYELEPLTALPLVKSEYQSEVAAKLLHLALLVSLSNHRDKKLTINSDVEITPLELAKCPFKSFETITKPMILGYILFQRSNKELFLVFTGTYNLCLLAMDIQYHQEEFTNLSSYKPGMLVHRGINILYQEIHEQLFNKLQNYLPQMTKLVITGHSLGGALSTICAADMAYYKPIHYSFGSPSIFNPITAAFFEKKVTASFRVNNSSDLITLIPLPIMPNNQHFSHVGTNINFQLNLNTYMLSHTLAYIIAYNLLPIVRDAKGNKITLDDINKLNN